MLGLVVRLSVLPSRDGTSGGRLSLLFRSDLVYICCTLSYGYKQNVIHTSKRHRRASAERALRRYLRHDLALGNLFASPLLWSNSAIKPTPFVKFSYETHPVGQNQL